MTSLIADPFPDHITLSDGSGIRVKTDFRLWLWAGKRIADAGDVLTGAGLCELVDEVMGKVGLERTETDDGSLLRAIVRFYLCGENPGKERRRGPADKAKARGRETPVYDFEFDSGAIYASFAQQYGIRLATIKEMHWWEFLTLLTHLGEDTPFRQRIRIRTMTAKDVARDKIPALREAQEALRIPESAADARIADNVAAYLTALRHTNNDSGDERREA